MGATTTIRELRNNFPRIRKLVEQEGEVVVTDHGTPKYRLTRLTPTTRSTTPAPKDYMARLRRHQVRSLSAAAAKALHDANRGAR
jgi:antitoxin (DNA-binding transcriptional repressor) of toxin-antitoxin stability system